MERHFLLNLCTSNIAEDLPRCSLTPTNLENLHGVGFGPTNLWRFFLCNILTRLTEVACSIRKVTKDWFSKWDVPGQLWSVIFHPDRNTQTVTVIFLQHPLRAWLTFFSQTWRKLCSCLIAQAAKVTVTQNSKTLFLERF